MSEQQASNGIVYHVEGYTQWAGTCVFHRRRDCRHLARKRSMGPMDMTGCIVEVEIEPGRNPRMCKHCRNKTPPVKESMTVQKL